MRLYDPRRENRQLVIRRMNRSDLNLAVDWAAAEGWNPGQYDAECFYKADPNGFFVGELDGQPVATISAVAYGDSFGFFGFYVVKPEFRGRGFGLRIWKEALAYLDGRNIGLDGVVAETANYEKFGFKTAFRHMRYRGVVSGARSKDVADLSSVSFSELADYDRELFPAQRIEFLRCWTTMPKHTGYGVMRQGQLAGYGVLRLCRSGFKIGPLFADDEEVAEDLFQAMAGAASGQPIFLDVPDADQAAVALATRHGMSVVFETVRMYNREVPAVAVKREFGVTTLELG